MNVQNGRSPSLDFVDRSTFMDFVDRSTFVDSMDRSTCMDSMDSSTFAVTKSFKHRGLRNYTDKIGLIKDSCVSLYDVVINPTFLTVDYKRQLIRSVWCHRFF